MRRTRRGGRGTPSTRRRRLLPLLLNRCCTPGGCPMLHRPPARAALHGLADSLSHKRGGGLQLPPCRASAAAPVWQAMPTEHACRPAMLRTKPVQTIPAHLPAPPACQVTWPEHSHTRHLPPGSDGLPALWHVLRTDHPPAPLCRQPAAAGGASCNSGPVKQSCGQATYTFMPAVRLAAALGGGMAWRIPEASEQQRQCRRVRCLPGA